MLETNGRTAPEGPPSRAMFRAAGLEQQPLMVSLYRMASLLSMLSILTLPSFKAMRSRIALPFCFLNSRSSPDLVNPGPNDEEIPSSRAFGNPVPLANSRDFEQEPFTCSETADELPFHPSGRNPLTESYRDCVSRSCRPQPIDTRVIVLPSISVYSTVR